MPEADTFQAPQGKAFHAEPLLQAVTEAFVGNGVLANGDAEVTADGSTQMGIDVSAADAGIAYGGSTYTPSASSFTLSNGPTTTTNAQDDRRVDIVYFDSSSGGYAVTEGTAGPNPVPASIPPDGLFLAVCLIPNGATDLSDANILNWRARPIGRGGFTVEIEFADGIHVGENPDDTITETSSPKGFTWSASKTRDVVASIGVDVSNSSGASATEDVTVELYDGTSTGGTLVDNETVSVNLNDGASTTESFLTAGNAVGTGDYYVNITQSGSDLSIDQTEVNTQGAEWSFVDDGSGTLNLKNSYTGTTVLSADLVTDELGLLSGAIDTAEIAADAVTDTEIGTIAGPLSLSEDGGNFGVLTNLPVTSTPSAGVAQRYAFGVDGTRILEMYAEADGSGGIQNARSRLHKDLYDALNGKQVYSTTDGFVPRAAVDDERELSGVKTANYTTSGEEVVPADSSGGPMTITLATADLGDSDSANFVVVSDVGGAATSNPITIDTEGGEGIDGGSSVQIVQDYGAKVLYADGTKWYKAGSSGVDVEDDGTSTVAGASSVNFGAGLIATDDGDGTATVDYGHADTFEGRESGAVSSGNQGILCIGNIADGETVEVYRAALVNADGSAVASSVDLKLVTLDNAGSFTTRATLITGDGSTVFDDETGSPLGSYTNSSGSPVTVAVVVDNQSGASVSIIAENEGSTGL